MTYHVNMHEKQNLHICSQYCQQMLQSDLRKICKLVAEDCSQSAHGFKSMYKKCFRSKSKLLNLSLYIKFTSAL